MKRLVYSPKVQAWISGTEGVVDVSPYIVSGSIDRKVNQVSSASLVLRNPVNEQNGEYTGTLFTDYLRTDGTIGPLFHPMDPIIITMQRLEGHNIQVFTGYLDHSPYLQFYPGLCQIDASCTLKRLLYTQFDAALPFVTYFLSLFGWVPDGQSGIINPSAETDQLKTFAGQVMNKFNDGSIGGLIYATLLYIGAWSDETIFIERLPTAITDYVVKLFDQLQTDVSQSQNIFQNLLLQILGTNSLGTGGSGGNGTVATPVLNAQQIVSTVAPIAAQYGIPLELPLATMYIETGFHDHDSAGNPHYGWFQCQLGGCYAYGPWSYNSGQPSSINQCHDLQQAATAFCAAAQGLANANPSLKQNLQQWAMSTQGVNAQNNPYYVTGWPDATATAQSYISRFGGSTPTTSRQNSNRANDLGGTSPSDTASTSKGSTSTTTAGTSPGGATGNTGSVGATGSMTRIEAMTEAANVIAGLDLPYVYGGGHGSLGTPTGSPTAGFDCSATVSNVLWAGGILKSVYATGSGGGTSASPVSGGLGAALLAAGAKPGIDTKPGAVNVYIKTDAGNNDHTFMQINGNFFGTSGSFSSDPSSSGPGWWDVQPSAAYLAGFNEQYHIPVSTLGQKITYSFPLGTASNSAPTGPGGAVGAGVAGGGTGGSNNATAAAFSTMINLPSTFQTAEAVAFTGKRAFIADSPLFPFVQQLCQASLRNFMSMPNGNFFAFFPDYFGLFGRSYYWQIKDIEIMDGRIDLSDDPLTTHLAIAGDVTQYSGTVNVFDLLLTAGIFDIFDAFALGYVSGPDSLVTKDLTESNLSVTQPGPGEKKAQAQSKQQAIEFLQKYGARTYIEEIPAIRSPFFELFYAFMKFMLLWSKQFQTNFEITFMPELFPGGLVAFPDHNLQLYCEQVTHTFDYTNGFTTTASFSSPSSLNGQRSNMREGLTRLSSNQFPTPINPFAGPPVRKLRAQNRPQSTKALVLEPAFNASV